ncbi:MAG TPA: hypothetical protein P5572_14245, partial [Phycisphaerae bacterium]|nr:hypothetical protein [Phycisphaerae bacterium]
MSPSRYLRRSICTLGLIGILAVTAPVSADPSAHFELRLAPDQPDADLILGAPGEDTLTVEVWIEVSDAPPGALVQSVGMLLRVTQDGVITYNDDYQS